MIMRSHIFERRRGDDTMLRYVFSASSGYKLP